MNASFLRVCLSLGFVIGSAAAQNAGAPRQNSGQNTPAGTGAIEGRVLNANNGQYLNNARVTVEGTGVQTFTNSYGEFRLIGVPVGTARVTVFYTGVPTQTVNVTVVANTTVNQNISVGGAGAAASPTPTPATETVKLDAFVVASQRETNGQAIAINEQRFAPNVQTVVSSDAFGDVAEGNVGEFLKFMPGVTVDYTAADVRNVSVRGVASNYTPVTVDGNRLASSASSSAASSLGRQFDFYQVSINNVSRVEVTKSRTPDMSADALGGSVNMVSKSAFERAKPELTYRAYAMMNSGATNIFHKTPGPGNESTYKVRPGFDLSYVNPVTKDFGYVVTALNSNMFNPQHRSNPQWAPNGSNSNIAGVTVQTPFLRRYTMQDGPKTTTRASLGGTFDWRFTPLDVLSLTVQDTYYEALFGNRNLNFDAGSVAPAAYDPTFTQGAAGRGSVTFNSSFRNLFGTTWVVSPRWRHNGRLWTIDAALSYSHASNHYQDYENGMAGGALYSLNNVTVRYEGINPVRPANITTTTASGATVNPFDVRNYTLTSFQFAPADASDVFRIASVNAARRMDWPLQTTLKAGAMVQVQTRDLRAPTTTYNYVAPAGIASTLADQQYSRVAPPFYLPQVTWPDNFALYDLWRAHPEYFQAGAAANIQNNVNNSVWFEERVTAGYVMGDTRALQNKLRVVYGIRFERTDDKGEGPLVNNDAIYQRDAAGRLIRNAAGALVPITTDPVQQAMLRYTERGTSVKTHYASGYPSVNVSYNFTADLVGRVAYSRSLGRPNLSNIVPSVSTPDPTAATGSTLITVNNSELRPEQVNSYDTSLEYYFNPVGVVSIGAFRKDFSNFFGTFTQPATAELLNTLGVPNPELFATGYDVRTTLNTGFARVTGVEFNFSQQLGFLPERFKGFGVFVNGTSIHLRGSPLADFNSFISRSANWGVSFDRRLFSAKLNWNYRGRQKLSALSFDPAGAAYEYFKPRTTLDLNVEWRIRRGFGIFFNGRNLTNVMQDDERFAPATPTYARLYRREEFGTQYTLGVKGTF